MVFFMRTRKVLRLRDASIRVIFTGPSTLPSASLVFILAMPGPLGFSAVPAELKPITAFVQRAEELKASEPVVAYWCTYYAAQLGIAQGAKGAAARAFLGELLGTLENMKLNISASDPEAKEVIDHETASAAYVEGFALKVFGMADNEDRAGKATRWICQLMQFERLSVADYHCSEAPRRSSLQLRTSSKCSRCSISRTWWKR